MHEVVSNNQNLKASKNKWDWLGHGTYLPTNRNLKNAIQEDSLLRELDCAVLETVHKINHKRNLPPFDSVRGVFGEKNHIQICIRNPNCIKGFFIPRETIDFKGIID